jgi:hypothetical protein
MENKFFAAGILATALVFGMTIVGCDDGSTNGNETNWWTWVSTEDDDYTSTAQVSIAPTSDDTGCDVSVTGTANDTYYNWASQVIYEYADTVTVGKTYKVTWKWSANNKPFSNVTIRYAQREDYGDDSEYQFGTDVYNKLTIPTSEETQTYVFTMPADCFNIFTFFIGEDTGSFKIRNFKIEEVTNG